MKDVVIAVKDLSVDFFTSEGSISAVDKVSFDIKKNEIFALVGESGCGKSTTASALMKLIREPGKITSGSVMYNSKDIVKMTEREMTSIRGKELSMIFQNPLDSLNPVQKVGKQIAEAVGLDKIPKKDAWSQALKILKSVKISDVEQRANSYPFEHSGGMRQRVMIGMMMSRSPKLLIADEPTTALDVTIQAQILDLIKESRDKHGFSVLIITHDFGIVAEIADRIGVMYAGNIVELGDVFTIFDNPTHPYTKLLMKALPTITKNEGRLNTIPGSVPNLKRPPAGCRFAERCPFCMERCKIERPEMREVEKGHKVACHLEVK